MVGAWACSLAWVLASCTGALVVGVVASSWVVVEVVASLVVGGACRKAALVVASLVEGVACREVCWVSWEEVALACRLA